MRDCVYPCSCGYWGDPTKECTDSFAQVMRYQNRISGPLFDRIDIHVEVPRVDYEKLSSDRMGEPSAKIRERVESARERQLTRFSGTALQGRNGSGRSQKILCNRRRGEELASCSDAADVEDPAKFAWANERSSVSSYLKTGADDCGFGWLRQNRDGAHCGGDSVSTEETDVSAGIDNGRDRTEC